MRLPKNTLIFAKGSQRGAVPVLALRGVLQVEEGVRGPLAEQARPQGDRQRREAQDAKGDARAKQGMYSYVYRHDTLAAIYKVIAH